MKISALTAATTPLSGAELFPIVQSGNTRRVSLNDLLRSIGNGTAAAPALAPGGDPNTGIYFPAADTIGFVEGGVEVWRMSSSGHFLAGTDNSFDIGASGANRPRDLFVGRNATVAGNLTVDTNTLFVDAANNRVGVGTSAPAATFHMVGEAIVGGGTFADALVVRGRASDSIAVLRFESADGVTPRAYFGNPAANVFAWYNGSFNERMRLDASGNLGVGLSAPAQRLDVQASTGGTTARFRNVNSGNFIDFFETNTATRLGYVGTTDGTNWTIHNDKNGYLAFDTNNLERARLDASGNLGLGVTPSAWSTGKAIEVGSVGSALYSFSATNLLLTTNAINNSGFKYAATGVASAYQQDAAVHKWLIAPSGTAGAAITFTQAMTLDASGNLGIGVTSPTVRLHVNAGSVRIQASSDGNDGLFRVTDTAVSTQTQIYSTVSGGFIGVVENKGLRFLTNNTERWIILAAGSLIAHTDNTVDIGASGSNRPRDLFLGRNVVAAGQGNFGNLVLGTVSASLSNVSTGMVGYADSHPSFGNGTLVLQARSSVARPIVFVTGATTGTARMSVKEDGQVRFVPLASAPTTNVEDGDVYYDSGTNKLRVRAGGAWTDLH